MEYRNIADSETITGYATVLCFVAAFLAVTFSVLR